MPENCEECSLLIRAKVRDTIGSCNAMQKSVSPKLAFGKPVFQKKEKLKHLRQRQDSVVLLKHMNPQDKEESQ